MKKVLLIMLVSLLLFSNVYANESSDDFVVTHSEMSSEEKYVQSLADELDITYEEAYAINQKENEKYLAKSKNKNKKFQIAQLDEIIDYKTVYGYIPIIGTPNYVEMAVEVKYVYSYATGKALEIMSVGAPYMYITGASSAQINGGDYNKEVYTSYFRISRTASLQYVTSDSFGIQVGGDVVSVSGSTSKTVTVTTRAKTYVLNVTLSDL